MAERIEVGVVIKGADKAATDITKVSDSAKGLGSSIEGADEMVELLEGRVDKMTSGAYSGFKKAATAIKTFITGLKLTKTAIIATGIGALVVAIGLLVTYWDDIATLIDGSNEKLIKQESNLRRQVSLQETELSLLKQKIEVEKLRNGESLLLTGEYKKQLLISQEQNLQLLEILQNQLEIEESKDKELSTYDKITAAAWGLLSPTAKALSIADSLASKGEKADEIQKKINESKKKGLDIELQLAQIDSDSTKRADDAAATEQEKIDAAKAKAEAERVARVNLEDELYALSLSAKEREELLAQQAYDKRVAIAGDDEGLLKSAEERLIADLSAIQKKADDDKEAAQKAIDDRLAAEKQIADDKTIAREEATAQAVRAARLGIVAAGFDALKAMAKTEEGQKRLAISQILVNQGIAMSEAFRGAQQAAAATGPAAPVMSPLFTAQMIGMVLSSFASIKGVMNQAGASSGSVGTSSGGGGGGSTQLALTPSLDSFGEGTLELPAVQAYILQNNIADADALQQALQNQSSL